MVRLETETKLITHAIRMAAFNAETTLARALNGSYARAADEAYALIREALTASGDIIPGDGTLTIRLDPLSAPRRTRAIAALCAQLNTTATCYPGTKLVLRYEVKEPPWHCINDLLCQESWGCAEAGYRAKQDVHKTALCIDRARSMHKLIPVLRPGRKFPVGYCAEGTRRAWRGN